jgi:heme/copper-type cytochrome/quinol oxidase subunit 2
VTSPARRLPRVAGLALGWLVALFFVVRGAVELAVVDPGRPASYAEDWGGPTYLGVVLVHAGPGLVVLVLAGLAVRARRRRRSRDRHDGERRSQLPDATGPRRS